MKPGGNDYVKERNGKKRMESNGNEDGDCGSGRDHWTCRGAGNRRG